MIFMLNIAFLGKMTEVVFDNFPAMYYIIC